MDQQQSKPVNFAYPNMDQIMNDVMNKEGSGTVLSQSMINPTNNSFGQNSSVKTTGAPQNLIQINHHRNPGSKTHQQSLPDVSTPVVALRVGGPG